MPTNASQSTLPPSLGGAYANAILAVTSLQQKLMALLLLLVNKQAQVAKDLSVASLREASHAAKESEQAGLANAGGEIVAGATGFVGAGATLVSGLRETPQAATLKESLQQGEAIQKALTGSTPPDESSRGILTRAPLSPENVLAKLNRGDFSEISPRQAKEAFDTLLEDQKNTLLAKVSARVQDLQKQYLDQRKLDGNTADFVTQIAQASSHIAQGGAGVPAAQSQGKSKADDAYANSANQTNTLVSQAIQQEAQAATAAQQKIDAAAQGLSRGKN